MKYLLYSIATIYCLVWVLMYVVTIKEYNSGKMGGIIGRQSPAVAYAALTPASAFVALYVFTPTGAKTLFLGKSI